MAELVDALRRHPVHTVTVLGRPDGVRLVLLSPEERDAMVAALERAERVALHAGRLIERINEFESCLRDRGITQAPCHGQPLRAVFDVRDVVRAALAAAPGGEGNDG